MAQTFPALPSARTLSVMPTYQCTAACRHCGTLSSPKVDTWLSVDAMLDSIRQAAESGYSLVVFTGGEPTLAPAHLYEGMELARGLGLRVRIVTNCWWATDDQAAEEVLTRLQRAGLQELNASTGDQHARFVPIENVLRAIAVGLDLNFEAIALMVEVVKERSVTRATVEAHPLFQERIAPRAARLSILESPWMPLSPSRISEYGPDLAANRENVASRTGCDSVLTTTTIQADGKIGACCGLGMRLVPELQVGRVGETSIAEADAAAADDFLKHWIRVEGPEKILSWAAGIDPSIKWENMYAHRCQACMRIYRDPEVRSVIREHHHSRIADVLAAEWLMFGLQSEDSQV